MADQRDPSRVAMLTKRSFGVGMNRAGFRSHTALINGLPVDISHDSVRLLLVLRGRANDNRAGLMSGIAVDLGPIIVADNISPLEAGVAFAAAGHRVAVELK